MQQMEALKPKWGPKMLALPNDRWRDFVTFWLDGPKGGGRTGGYTNAARKAGFSPGGSDKAVRVTASRLAADQRIQEAIQEEARKRLNSLIPMSIQALEDIVGDATHKDRLTAVKGVLDRAGLHEISETKHTHEFIANDPIMLERVRQMALRLKIPVERLLGRSAALLPVPTAPAEDAEFQEVESGSGDKTTE